MTTKASSPEEGVRRVSPEEVYHQKNVLLVDVRTGAEFEEVHVEGAVLQPLHDIDVETIKERAKGKDACILICRSGKRASQAAETLRNRGLPAIQVLEGGITAWESAGLPLKRGAKVISLERQVRIAAGALVFTGAALGYFVNPAWIALAGLVGAGLVFAGITDTCGMGLLLARMPWNDRRPRCTAR